MPDPLFQLEPVEPTGERMRGAFEDRYDEGTSECVGAFVERVVPTYPPSPDGQRFRELRHEAGVSLGDVARAWKLSVVAVSDLERGRQRPKRPTTWGELFAALVKVEKTRA